jgi:hypothetical protein
MNQEEQIILQGLKLEIGTLAYVIQELKTAMEASRRFEDLPEWVTLEKAAALKGGPALATYQTRLFLQPCCGRNYKLAGGRKCWHRDEVIRWLSITDSGLSDYAREWKVSIPENYERRSV